MTNTNQHKKWVAGVFDRASETYDLTGPRIFTHYGKGLVAYSEIRSGSRILDVACGSGAVLIPASAVVGKQGIVVGIDICNGMVRRLEKDLEQRGIANAKNPVRLIPQPSLLVIRRPKNQQTMQQNEETNLQLIFPEGCYSTRVRVAV